MACLSKPRLKEPMLRAGSPEDRSVGRPRVSVAAGSRLPVVALALVTWLAFVAAASADPLPSCASTSPDGTAAASAPTVTVNPATAWQPRSGEVLVELRGDPATLAGMQVRACMGWSGEGPGRALEGAVRMRPSDISGVYNFGVVVPNLPCAAAGWPARVFTGTPASTGFGIVPLADLRLIIGNQQAVLVDLVRPVGITSLWYASTVTLAAALLALAILQHLASRRGTPGSLLLRLIVTRDGLASLSQLQVLIWTFVIGASVVYVMSLSGQLINVTAGTLVLLGIAGGAGVLSGLASKSGSSDRASTVLASAPTDGASPSAARVQPSPVAEPSWSDLVAVEGSSGTDMTRVQMLFFTLLTAVFVLMRVLTSYVIPDIPDGYLLLMGISNGIYLGGKFSTARA